MWMPVVVGAKVGSDGVCHQYTCTLDARRVRMIPAGAGRGAAHQKLVSVGSRVRR